uniref:OSIGBa0137D06.6 protein n=1 Tax=Oryza sativa TaxID=4530 RepID=Q01IN5_ORYSA|nr:OSIGBa0137D06.6 [Oryza sativa]
MTQTKEEAKGGGGSKKPEVKKGKNYVSEFDDDEDDLLEFDKEPRVIRDKKGDDLKGGARVKVCSRCTQKGHGVADCKVDVYCDICDCSEHVNHKCPVLKLPKPVVQAVGYAVEGLGFQHIPHQPLQRNKNYTKEGSCAFVWWCSFGGKGELQRAINFGGADVKEGGVATGVRVEFEEWFEEEEGFLLPKVLDVVIGDHYFELKFEVEKKGVDENGEEVEFNLEDWDGDEEDGNIEGEESGEDNEEREKGPKMSKVDDMVTDDNHDRDVLEEVYERVEREELEENEVGVQQEKIVQLANVGEVSMTPKRASERLMGSSGRHSLEKAKSRKAWMNLDPLSDTKEQETLTVSHENSMFQKSIKSVISFVRSPTYNVYAI